MKKFFPAFFSALLFSTFLPSNAHAFRAAAPDAVESLRAASSVRPTLRVSSAQGTIRELRGRFSITPRTDASEAVLDFIEAHRRAFGLADPKNELKLRKKKEYREGDRHFRYQQTYNGLPVWGKQMLVTVNSGNELEDVTANYIPTASLDTAPAFSAQEAVQKALDALAAAGQSGQMWKAPESELLVYPSGGEARLAYLVRLSVSSPPGWWFVFVDAKDGSIIKRFNNIKYDGAVPGTGQLWDDSCVNIELYDHSGTYSLTDASKPMANVQPTDFTGSYTPFLSNGTISAWDAHNLGNYTNTTQMTDPDADGNVYKSESGGRLTSGVNILYYQAQVFGFFKDAFGRNSWDDAGGSLLGVAHYGNNFPNAYWNGSFMTYGDGDGTYFTDFSQGLDVIAHEIGHAVTQTEVPPDGLTYWAQSGAMNEHFSDFWGISVDSGNYLLGESIVRPPYAALRDFAEPGSGSALSPVPDSMSDFFYSIDDEAGVHSNCGILNRAAYRMITSPAIGREKTQQLYYRAYDYLLPDSQFYDLKEALKKAARCAYPDEYTGIAGAINSIYASSGITAPPAKATLRYDNGTMQSSWYSYNNGYYDFIGFGAFFMPYYSGTVDGVEVKFVDNKSSANKTVDVVVYDVSPYYDFTVLTQTTATVSNFTSNTYIALPPAEYDHSFLVMVYPYSSNPAVAYDNGSTTLNVDKYNTNFVEGIRNSDNGDYLLWTDKNFFIRPHVTYDFSGSLNTLGFTQDGGKVTVKAEVDRAGGASGASVVFEASTDGGATWSSKGTATSDSNGFCSKAITLGNGTYQVRARYGSSGSLVSDPPLDVVVQPVVTATMAATAAERTPTVSWTAFNYAGATVTGYEVQVSRTSAFKTVEGTASYAPGDTSGALPRLAAGVRYYWRVVADLATGKSVPSAPRQITYKDQPALVGLDARESLLKVQPQVTLLDSFGNPVPGRRVTFSYLNRATGALARLGTAKTNYQGTAWLPAPKALPAGTYEITAAFAGDKLYSSAPDAGPVTVALPAAEATGDILVTITDYDTGQPVPGASVGIYTASAFKVQAPGTTTETTDAGGSASFFGLGESFTYALKVSRPGYVSLNCYNVAVAGGASAAVNVSLIPAGAATGGVGGTVTDAASGAPVSGAALRLRAGPGAYAGAVVKSAVTAADGSYSVAGLNAGVYTAEVFKKGYKQNFIAVYCSGGTTTAGQDAGIEAF